MSEPGDGSGLEPGTNAVSQLDRVKQDTSTIAKVESEPRLEGRQMVMVLAPR